MLYDMFKVAEGDWIVGSIIGLISVALIISVIVNKKSTGSSNSVRSSDD